MPDQQLRLRGSPERIEDIANGHCEVERLVKPNTLEHDLRTWSSKFRFGTVGIGLGASVRTAPAKKLVENLEAQGT